jgi:hypothetical protein
MCKAFIFSASFVLITFLGFTQKPYQIKSCRIELTYDLGYSKGYKTVVFTDSGTIEKEIVKQFNDTSLIRKLFPGGVFPEEGKPSNYYLLIHEGDTIFSIDLDSMSGSRRSALSGNYFVKPGFFNEHDKVGSDTFLGRKCDIMKMGGLATYFWCWKGMVLKKETRNGDLRQVVEYATSVDENYAIKPDEFEIPNRIIIK